MCEAAVAAAKHLFKTSFVVAHNLILVKFPWIEIYCGFGVHIKEIPRKSGAKRAGNFHITNGLVLTRACSAKFSPICRVLSNCMTIAKVILQHRRQIIIICIWIKFCNTFAVHYYYILFKCVGWLVGTKYGRTTFCFISYFNLF